MCAVMNLDKKNPLFTGAKKYVETTFPTLPHSCPLVVGPNYAYNISIGTLETIKVPGLMGATLPNGLYRFTVTIGDEIDPMTFQMVWFDQVRNRLGEEEF
jgi:hypothetical protein